MSSAAPATTDPSAQRPRTTLSANGTHPVLVGGTWRASAAADSFTATDPKTGARLPDAYPISGWADLEAALAAADSAARQLRTLDDGDAGERIASFFETYASSIEANADELCAIASRETGLPVEPRLKVVELPRTTGQLRQAATAARDGSWRRPVIDTKAKLRSCLAPIGPVFVIGPNNFPFAFNGISGGDFAAALAAGNPVIAKGHPLHPTTTRLFAQLAHAAATAAGLPAGTIQLVYHLAPADGLKMVADPRLKAIGFTGSRAGGMKLKAAADAAGKLFFGEMSSVNPVVLLPGALGENLDGIVDQLVMSVLMGTGQFCTKPGIVLFPAGSVADTFVEKVKTKLGAAPCGPLFSEAGRSSLLASIQTLTSAGAHLLVGGSAGAGPAVCVQNTLLKVEGATFLKDAHAFQTEAFGNATLLVVTQNNAELCAILEAFEGNLTATIYSSATNADDAQYAQVAAILRPRVGRLIDDKMPTGVAVSPAMNHGGPYPATSQPHFTAVGLPASIARFTQLESYDNVTRANRLPPCLRDANPNGRVWRQIDGIWTQN